MENDMKTLREFVTMFKARKMDLKLYDRAAFAAGALGLGFNITDIIKFIEDHKEEE